ncbi:MAG: L-seryl-tRNA(Sec) selenium transferase [Acidobacteria bacterium]|nr:L-seryl-tRNA(Sec) selenium transferase [Acidobacteriota bacterium]
MTLQTLPSVEALLYQLRAQWPQCPHALLKLEAQRAIAQAREALQANTPAVDPAAEASRSLGLLLTPSLRPVINATGVVLHTNLGRAPLPAMTIPGGYCNLEYELSTGKRGKRDAHLGPLLERLLGAPAIAVNNNAAAVFLVLNALAKGGEVIVSRGELIEIGDGFRIPDIMRAAGVKLVEVGATNKTSLDDYKAAITPATRMLLRVHPSNFHITGFTAKPALKDLCKLGVPVYEDLGSGCLIDLKPYGINEPLIRESLEAGVDIVSFSGDKLLGGTQAGFICGRAELVAKARRHPMYRALRLDKLVINALETMLRSLLLEDYEKVPALAMLRHSYDAIAKRAHALAAKIPGAEVIDGHSLAGGGSTPDQTLPTALIAVDKRHERRLRANKPPIIARVDNNKVLIDLRTVLPEEEPALRMALAP